MADGQRARRAIDATREAARAHPLDQLLAGSEAEQQNDEQHERRREQQRDAGMRGAEHPDPQHPGQARAPPVLQSNPPMRTATYSTYPRAKATAAGDAGLEPVAAPITMPIA